MEKKNYGTMKKLLYYTKNYGAFIYEWKNNCRLLKSWNLD